MATVSIPPRPQRYVRNDSQLANSIPGALMRVGCRERHRRVPFLHSSIKHRWACLLPLACRIRKVQQRISDKLPSSLPLGFVSLFASETRSGRWDGRVFVISHRWKFEKISRRYFHRYSWLLRIGIISYICCYRSWKGVDRSKKKNSSNQYIYIYLYVYSFWYRMKITTWYLL